MTESEERQAVKVPQLTNVESISARFALYFLNRDTLPDEASGRSQDTASQDTDESELQLVASSLSSEQENQLKTFLIRRLKKGAIYTGTGAFSGMDFSLGGSSPAVCYYMLLPCDALICLLAVAEANLEVFRNELTQFCEQLAPHIKEADISGRLASWPVVCLLYVNRVIDALGPKVACLLQLAQQNKAVASSNSALMEDLRRFLSACAVTECLGAEPSVETDIQLEGVKCNVYCTEWGKVLQEYGSKAEPWRLRKVLEAFKLKTIKDMNMLKRLLKLAETDHYALYRAYSFLWQSGNSNVLLEQAALEGGSSPAVLAALHNHLAVHSPIKATSC